MKDEVNRIKTPSGADMTIWSPLFIQIFVIQALLSLGHFMMSTLLPQYAEQLGASPAMVGTVAGAFAITALAVRPIVGPAVSSFRHQRLFAFAIGMMLVSFVCYGLADSVVMLLVGRMLQGVGMGFLVPVSMAMVSEVLPDRKLASGIGIFSLGQALSMAVGPSAGIYIMRYFEFQGVVLAGSLLVALSLLLLLLLKSQQPRRTQKFRIVMKDIFAMEVLVPTVMMFFLSGAQSCIQAFILIYGGVNGVEEIGLFFTAYAVFLLISRPVSGRIADKYGMDKVLIPGILIFALSFIVLSFASTLPMIVIAGAISAFGYGICQPLIQTLCLKLVARERRGVASNTNYFGVDIGYLIMPIIAGLVVSAAQDFSGSIVAGYEVMFRMMTVPIAAALLIYVFHRKKISKAVRQNEIK